MQKKLLGKDNPQYRSGLERYRTFKWLYKKYWIEELSLSQIAKIVGVDIKCISKWMDKVSIPRRQCGSRTGRHNHSFKGFSINSQGYKQIYSPNHPNHDSRNYVREHILVIEKYLGRYLLPNETSHHINEDKLDNRLENLYLFLTSAEHSRYHRLKQLNSPKFTPITQSNLSKFK